MDHDFVALHKNGRTWPIYNHLDQTRSVDNTYQYSIITVQIYIYVVF